MTLDEFDAFVGANSTLSYQTGIMQDGCFRPTPPEEGQGLAFRWIDVGLPFYDRGGMVFVEAAKLSRMSPADLENELTRGFKVEGITRITGYFTKTSSWNLGKRGELKDRFRNQPHFNN